MEIKEIEIWKNKLLDLSKKNNLLNYKDTKGSTIDIVYPSIDIVFKKLINENTVLSIYDDKLEYSEDDIEYAFKNLSLDYKLEEPLTKEDYILRYANNLKNNQILLFKEKTSFKKILNNLKRKTYEYITERGVNILYASFGFIEWKETIESDIYLKAPILLVPIKIIHETTNSPYEINICDDDILVNPTFKYLLENEHGITLPEYIDESINDYLLKVYEIVNPLKWKVTNEMKISTFSFNKLNMYFDIDKNKDEISNNINVMTLTGNSFDNNQYSENIDIDNKDLFLKENNVVDADYSQTEAIKYAIEGKSFVLQGPPGTGKSQTITNIISELIYRGKKVLFVSEKMAALEVVYNNMKKVGLEDFCLQLHSYKTNKREFIDNLYNSITTTKIGIKGDPEKNQKELEKAKDRLDKYVTELYKIYTPINKTPYEMMEIINHLKGINDLEYVIKNIERLGENELNNTLELFDKYLYYTDSIGINYKNNPLYGFNINNSSYSFKIELRNNIERALYLYEKLYKTFTTIKEDFNVEVFNKNDIKDFLDYSKLIIDNGITDSNLYDLNKLNKLIVECKKLNELKKEIVSSKNKLSEHYNDGILDEDGNLLYNKFINEYSKTFSRIFRSDYKLLNNRLKTYQKNINEKIKYTNVCNLLFELKKYQKNLEDYNNHLEIEKYSLNDYKGLDTDYESLIKALEKFYFILNNNRNFLSMNINKFNIVSIDKTKEYVNKSLDLLNDISNIEMDLQYYFDKNIFDFNSKTLDEIYKKIRIVQDNYDNLDHYISFLKLLSEIKLDGKLDFIDKVIDLNLDIVNIKEYYKYCFYIQWMDYVLNESPVLNEYTRDFHDKDVDLFKEKDRLEIELSKSIIKAKLSQDRPDPSEEMYGSPAKVIEREHEKKRKLKPIRTLMSEIPDFISRIKPCFLMSPLSVSTYIDSSTRFDVTIFDEASQVFPEDALVAIYRSKQLIVVGDSKQMPPTNFFNTLDALESEEYTDDSSDVSGFESILDLSTTVYPKKSLLYHYRSKNESLITFSNKNFYDYNLISFPSTTENKMDSGVDFDYCEDGVFDHKTKTNMNEALRVVDLVYEHFKKYPNRSLGVVTFNINQQNLIENIIQKRRIKDSSMEEYFNENRKEPFFVKNIETVQGDERDTIIFGITYSKDNKGQFNMRFGPLNLIGGERRLNVAITRAKINFKVVSSIHSYDIDVRRVTNVGPKLLHDYLEYAENGRDLNNVKESNSNEHIEEVFENDVLSFIRENGFDCDRNIGSSKFKINIGVKCPLSNEYFLAIECDSKDYKESKSTRDRDRLRENILESNNWKYYRIWSIDWYKNNKKEKERLLKTIDDYLNKKEDEKNDNESFSEEVSKLIEETVSEISYEKTELFDEYNLNLLDSVYYLTPVKCVETIANYYAPISIEYLIKKYGYRLGMDKCNDNNIKTIKDISRTIGLLVDDDFIYTVDSYNYSMRKGFNNPNEVGLKTEIKYVSPIEIRNGMYGILEYYGSYEKTDLYYAILKNLGYSKMTENIKNQLDKGFIELIPLINMENDKVTLKNKSLILIHRKP